MTYTFTLHDTVTDKTIEYKEDYDWPEENQMLWQWTENNYDCDCNRSIFLYGHDKKYECGEKIVLKKITREDGTEVPF